MKQLNNETMESSIVITRLKYISQRQEREKIQLGLGYGKKSAEVIIDKGYGKQHLEYADTSNQSHGREAVIGFLQKLKEEIRVGEKGNKSEVLAVKIKFMEYFKEIFET